MAEPNIPLFGSIGRLVEQKGMDIMLGALEEMLSANLQFVLLGSGDPPFERAFQDLARRFPSEYVLFLNPDTVLRPSFVEELVRVLDALPDAASASGKLLRMDGKTIDSTGIIMLREQRHLDRGADQPDTGQFDTAGEIFGPSGAAAM